MRDRCQRQRQELPGQRYSGRRPARETEPRDWRARRISSELRGIEHLDKMIAIDQSPIGRTPRSNPGTYIKLFDEIRKLYAQLPESKREVTSQADSASTSKGGRCEACEGNGSNKLEMDFLADVWVTCPVCQGHRFNRETLQVKYRDKSIAEVLEMDDRRGNRVLRKFPQDSRRSCRRCTMSG